MSFLRSVLSVAVGPNVKIRRLINYWAITAVLYLLCAGVLWFEVVSAGARQCGSAASCWVGWQCFMA